MLKKNLILFLFLAIFYNFSQIFALDLETNPELKKETSKNVEKIALSIEGAVKSALENHVDIKRSALSLNQSESEYNHSWNNVLPSVNVSANGEKQKGTGESKTDTTSIYAGISASLSLDLGLAQKIKGLKSSYKAGLLSYEETVRSTEFAVRSDYYNLLLLFETYKSSKTNMESYERQYNQTRSKFDRGTASELDLLTAQVNFETSKPEVETAKSNYYEAVLKFCDTIGLEITLGTEIELLGSLDYSENAVIPENINLEESVANSIEVRILENSVKNAEYSKKSQAAKLYLPSFTFSGTFAPKVYSLDNNTENSSDNPYWDFSLGVSLPIDSWILGSSANDTVNNLKNTVTDYKLQLEDKKKSVRTKILENLRNIEISKETLETRHLNVDLAKKSYEMTETAYNHGTKDLLTLQNSVDTLHTAQLQLMEEQYKLISNVLELENILGVDADEFFKKNE